MARWFSFWNINLPSFPGISSSFIGHLDSEHSLPQGTDDLPEVRSWFLSSECQKLMSVCVCVGAGVVVKRTKYLEDAGSPSSQARWCFLGWGKVRDGRSVGVRVGDGPCACPDPSLFSTEIGLSASDSSRCCKISKSKIKSFTKTGERIKKGKRSK